MHARDAPREYQPCVLFISISRCVRYCIAAKCGLPFSALTDRVQLYSRARSKLLYYFKFQSYELPSLKRMGYYPIYIHDVSLKSSLILVKKLNSTFKSKRSSRIHFIDCRITI